MKKAIFLLSAIFLTSIMVNCQHYEVKVKTKNSDTEKQSFKPNKKQVYYFINLQVDTSIFHKDSLVLSKRRINTKSPTLELYEDSSFSFCYNINLDTIRNEDEETGQLIVSIIENSEKIYGVFKTNDIQKNICLIIKDEKVINYSVVDKNDLIYFIRIK